MEHKGKPKGYVTPIEMSKAAQKIRAYRYVNRIYQSKLQCMKEMKLSRNTVIKWWDKCELSEEDINNLNAVKQWMIDNHSNDHRQCSIEFDRDPISVKADMMAIESWYNYRI